LPLGDAPLAPVEPAVLPARLSRPPLKRRPASDDSLMAEAALVDRARLQLWRRDGEGARQTADSYLARFPHGRLAAEAQVIRVHAALLTGGPTAAAPLARAFLRLYPDSPHAPAMRRVLTE
jgi:outer membrane protein assembly factor BamD (BamD/ComL family)